jgi:hypothetical protein
MHWGKLLISFRIARMYRTHVVLFASSLLIPGEQRLLEYIAYVVNSHNVSIHARFAI